MSHMRCTLYGSAVSAYVDPPGCLVHIHLFCRIWLADAWHIGMSRKGTCILSSPDAFSVCKTLARSVDKIEPKYLQAVELIKKAILQSQYDAIRLANQEQMKLYFGIGRNISENSRNGFWDTGALEIITAKHKNDLPGLMGFGVTSLKNMRKFYEA